MNRTSKSLQPSETLPAPEQRLSPAERAELERQGAKAAARGESADTNPLGQPRNKPALTGETADTWWQRNNAWEKGHQAQSATQRKTMPPTPQGGNDDHD